MAERGERVSGTDMQRSFGDGAQAIGNARESWGNEDTVAGEAGGVYFSFRTVGNQWVGLM